MSTPSCRVGRVYGHFEGKPLWEYPCQYGCGDCCHFQCRLKALRDAGQAAVAERLEANHKAKDWLSNWGKLLYDPREHGRDPQRRTAAARIVLEMRRNAMNYADAVRTGCWAGAVLWSQAERSRP
jgi:hypothetical protein